MPLLVNLTSTLETINQILTAGVAITAISLLMYATSFNFKDRVAQVFGLILVAVAVIYTSEIIANVSNRVETITFWLRVKWVGLVMLPAVYLHFSDALLTLVGRPSRGRRRMVVSVVYFVSAIGAILVWLGITVGRLAATPAPMPYLERNIITLLFGMYYILVMLMAAYNLARIVIRSITTTTRRRLIYLFAGASAPALSAVIFLFHGNQLFADHPDVFWSISIIAALLTDINLIIMAYVVSFFGVTWTDRAVKSRLFRWLLRGPVTAALVLGLTTIVRRWGASQGDPYSPYVPIAMVSTLLIMEYAITLISPKLENWLFFGSDREDLETIRKLENSMLTQKDLNQFLETIASSVCDRLQVNGAFIAVVSGDEVDYFIQAGNRKVVSELPVTEELIKDVRHNGQSSTGLFDWGGTYLLPLNHELEDGSNYLLGILGFPQVDEDEIDQEEMEAVWTLAERAALALTDRALQKQVIRSISAIQSEVDYIQDLRASTSYAKSSAYQARLPEITPELTDSVKDALTHFWGGPKLTNNPLMNLKVVEAASDDYDGSRINALRAVLKNAIERTRPEGERKFTGDWILYNILEMKFLQGKKVREVAHKLAVSEADLYRKQRVALENVAQNIALMENEINGSEPEETPNPSSTVPTAS